MQLTYEMIKSFNLDYEPEEIGITESYSATIVEFINEYRNKVKHKYDITRIVCRNDFMPDKDLRLFAVWCARKVQHWMPDQRSINALNIAELFAYGKATQKELMVAGDVVRDAAWEIHDGVWDAAHDAAWVATWDVAANAALYAFRNVARVACDEACNTPIDKLLSYFIAKENNLQFDWKAP